MKVLPLHYAVRNLMRDPMRLLQTVGGSGLVVLLVMSAHALNDGIDRTMQGSAEPANVMLMSAGSEESVQRSEVSEKAAGVASASVRGVETVMGTRAVSPEIVHMGYLNFADGSRARGLLRGVKPEVLLTHRSVRLTEGRFPGPGELLVGRMAWKTFGVEEDQLAMGETVTFDGAELTVVGSFVNPGSVRESEIWMDLEELRTLAQRDSVSTVVMRLDEGEVEDVKLFTKQRFDLELHAMSEVEYYAKLSAFYQPVRIMVWITAILIAVSAVFGGLNTLYAAFAARVKETATLQSIGYPRRAVLWSFVQESMMASFLGTLLGAVLASLLLSSFVVRFSAGAVVLRIEPETLFVGLATGVLLGLIGALPPAVRCLKPPLPVALRDSA